MTAQQQTTEAPAEAKAVATIPKPAPMVVHDDSSFANLLDTGKFEHMWRVAQVFSKSGMVPKHFAGKPEACFVAVQMAVRLEVDPFMFMQNTYTSPDGKPAMEGKLAIALINARGPFKGGVQFSYDGEGDDYGCTATGIHKADGKPRTLKVDIATAKAEGWYSRNKKWQTMQDQMLLYRAGAWFGRAYCPEVLMGMQTIEEREDVGALQPGDDGVYAPALPPRPTRARPPVEAQTESTDAEAEAANREMDRQATGEVDTNPPEEETEAETVADPEPRMVEIPTTPNGKTKDWRGYTNACRQDLEAAPSVAFIEAWRSKQGKNLDQLKISFPEGFAELVAARDARLGELKEAA